MPRIVCPPPASLPLWAVAVIAAAIPVTNTTTTSSASTLALTLPRYEAAIKTTERVAEQKSLSKGPHIPVQPYDETGRCPVVGSCGGGDLGVMPDTENNDAGALPDDGDAGSLCVGSDCNGGGGGGKKGKKEEA